MYENATNIVFLTGAGVSVDSGIPDFQTINDTWPHDIPREDVFSRLYFRQHPEEFWKYYRETFVWDDSHKPNAFHKLPELLAATGRTVTVVTQNIDGLHGEDEVYIDGKLLDVTTGASVELDLGGLEVVKDFGTLEVLEMHGNASRAICPVCLNTVPMGAVTHLSRPTCKECNVTLKPDISLFGEGVSHLGLATDAVTKADLLIVAGTSLNVGPVNELPMFLNGNWRDNQRSVWVNPSPVPNGYSFDKSYHMSAVDFVDAFIKEFNADQ